MRAREKIESVVVRFAGDSGDGIQLTGLQFSNESAVGGADLVTLPSYPAEIRAPAGSLFGVSSFQIHLGDYEINTPGDSPNVLVAMNPAALKVHLGDLERGGIVIVNEDAFSEKNLARAGYAANPCTDADVGANYRLYTVPMSKMCKEALQGTGLSSSEIERCKNFFALGVMLFLFNRPLETTVKWIETKFKKNPKFAEANSLAVQAGAKYADATELFDVTFVVDRAPHAAGTYKNISGSLAVVYGLLAAAAKAKRELFFAAYPITPASDILHELSQHSANRVKTFQAEDEIAAICASIGASFAGALGVTATSGPGLALKTEALGLAVISELPLVVIDVQRVGPSTGIPTRSEQSDLFHALYGRPGESPLVVLAVSSPKTAFDMSYEACRIAMKFMTPVILLSEGFITNTSEPWRIPPVESLREIESPPRRLASDDGEFLPYLRDEHLARSWALPGDRDAIHYTGGLEKQDRTGAISYDPENHERMTRLRADKIQGVALDIPPLEVDGALEGDLLLLGWGSTEGTIKEAVRRCRQQGMAISRAHLWYLNPFPRNTWEVLSGFKRVLVPELNMGQLAHALRATFGRPILSYTRASGAPIKVQELEEYIQGLV